MLRWSKVMTSKHYFTSSFLKIIILPDGFPGGLTAGAWAEKNKIKYFKDLQLWNQYYPLLLRKKRYCLLVNRSLYPNTKNLNLNITFEHWHQKKMPKVEKILIHRFSFSHDSIMNQTEGGIIFGKNNHTNNTYQLCIIYCIIY